MKLLTKILMAVGVLIVILLIITIFLPSTYTVERNTNIKTPAYKIYYQIATTGYWDKWDPWMDLDLKQKRVYSGAPYGKGSYFTFESAKSSIGKGKVEITRVNPMMEVDYDLSFVDSPDSSFGSFKLIQLDSSTNVTWKVSGKLSFLKKWFGFMMEGVVGNQFEKGLAKLKNLCEKLPPPDISMEITELKPQIMVYVKDSGATNTSEIVQKFNSAFNETMNFIRNKAYRIAGPAMGISENVTYNSYVFMACIPVEKIPQTVEGLTGRVQIGTTPSGRMLKAVHRGPFEEGNLIYQMMSAYIEKNHLEKRGNSFEKYISDPTLFRPYDIITEVYYPIK